MTRDLLLRWGVVLMTTLALAACGGSSGDSAVAAPSPAPSPAPTPAPAPAIGLSLFAGSTSGFGNVDGKGSQAYFELPRSLAVTPQGVAVVSDQRGLLRSISPDGTVAHLAGVSGELGIVDGVGREARLIQPQSLAAAPDGTVYFLDGGGADLRRITPDGRVTTLVRPGPFRSNVATAPDGTPHILTPEGISTWSATSGLTLRIPIAGRSVPYVDGPPGTGTLGSVNHIAVDADGSVYLTDRNAHTVRKLTSSGSITTIAGRPYEAGSADGTAGQARFSLPEVIYRDAARNLWVQDGKAGLRRVTREGEVGTVAAAALAGSTWSLFDATGDGVLWLSNGTGISRIDAMGQRVAVAGQNDPATAGLAPLVGLGVDAGGNVLIAESGMPSVAPQIVSEGTQVFVSKRTANGTLLPFGGRLLEPEFPPPASFAFPRPWGVRLGMSATGETFVAYAHESVSGTLEGVGGGIARVQADGSGVPLATWTRQGPQPRLSPACMRLGRDGAFYFVDLFTYVLVRWTPATGPQTLADLNPGNPIVMMGARCWLLAADAGGRAYVVKRNAIYRAENGQLVLLAGSDNEVGTTDGLGAAARFMQISAIAAAPDGSLYVGDQSTVRKVTPEGLVTTVVGQRGLVGLRPGPLPGILGRFISNLAVADDGTLFIASDSALVKVRFP